MKGFCLGFALAMTVTGAYAECAYDKIVRDIHREQFDGKLVRAGGVFWLEMPKAFQFCLVERDGARTDAIERIHVWADKALEKRMAKMVGRNVEVIEDQFTMTTQEPMMHAASVDLDASQPRVAIRVKQQDAANVSCEKFETAQGSREGDAWYDQVAELSAGKATEGTSTCTRAESVRVICKANPSWSVGAAVTDLMSRSRKAMPMVRCGA